MEKKLSTAEKRLSTLHNELSELDFAKNIMEQQHEAITALEQRLIEAERRPTGPTGEDEDVRELAGVLETVDNAIRNIEEENPNEEDKEKVINGGLVSLEKQADGFKELAEKSTTRYEK